MTGGRPGRPDPEVAAGIRLWLAKSAASVLGLAAILFVSAGRLDWGPAWAYLALWVAGIGLTALVVVPAQPALVAERARGRFPEGTKGWDKVVCPLAAVAAPVAIWVTAGLDARFGWSPPFPPALVVAALALAGAGYVLIVRAMAANPFFSATVRIQAERGHRVVGAGPYRVVRHPGYLGWCAFLVATPVILGSVWALVPAGLGLVLVVLRTALEDRMLRAELEGYRAYAARVRFRLLPGIW